MHAKSMQAALEWYLDHGVDEALADSPNSRTAESQIAVIPDKKPAEISKIRDSEIPILGKSDAAVESARLAAQANTLEELKEAMRAFDGLAIKKTATNLVFCDGNPQSKIMLVGEAPGADEDRLGKPFVGVSGQLLDRILKCIDLDRAEEDPKKSLYISNILNWRPPGNRTPSPAEIEVSLPFIEKHIMLVQPKILILCGGVSAKALLSREEGISRLRKTWHSYKPQTSALGYEGPPIPAIATYHPAYLLRTPSQKKAVWADMLAILEKSREIGIK